MPFVSKLQNLPSRRHPRPKSYKTQRKVHGYYWLLIIILGSTPQNRAFGGVSGRRPTYKHASLCAHSGLSQLRLSSMPTGCIVLMTWMTKTADEGSRSANSSFVQWEKFFLASRPSETPEHCIGSRNSCEAELHDLLCSILAVLHQSFAILVDAFKCRGYPHC